MTVLSEVAWETFFREGSAVSNGTVIAVVSFVGASHYVTDQ